MLLGGTVAWPLATRAQQRDRIRRIGVLIPFGETDPETQVLISAFRQRFQELGWTDGRNVRLDYRFTDGNPERTRAAGVELVGLAPDVIAFRVAAAPTDVDLYVIALGPAQLRQALQPRRVASREHADAPHALRLLRKHSQRPRDRCA